MIPPPWETAVKYRYARSDFAVGWYDVYDGERSEGTLGVSFSMLPERIRPNEPLSIPVNLQSSCSMEAAEYVNRSISASAGIEYTRYLFTGADGETGEVWYTFSTYPETPYAQTETLQFSLPGPSENVLAMGETDTITFDFMLVMPDADSLVTTYTYEWKPAGEAETPKPAGIIALKGMVLSAEA